MAVRNESVRLSLQDDFTSGMARAAAATALFKRELDGLDGKNVSRDLDDTSKSVDKVARSSGKAGPEVDRLSGRLRILTDAAVSLGPALIPLGAGTIPLLTGALSGLGAAAGGLGVAILAFKGLGDGIKAIDAYRLEPTVQNLAKMREEMAKLGPAGAEFAHYVTNLEPTLRDLQNTARSGLFPGVEDGIDQLLTRLPDVQQIVNRLSREMGDLASESGTALASKDFTPFFDYVKSDAAPTLDAFARSAGNVTLGVANMLVAFAPLSRDFTGGLLNATQAFAEWSKTLDANDSFQSFLQYVREAGPQAVDFLLAITKAASALIQAAAPLGRVVLPALTALANVFADIAASPIGPGLYTAAAALLAFNRAASIVEKTNTKLSASFAGLDRRRALVGLAGGLGLLAASATDADDKLGLANTTMDSMAGLLVGGPFGFAIGAAVGQFQDFKKASDDVTASLKAADDAMRDNNTQQIRQQLAGLTAEYDKLINGDAKITNFGSQWDAVKGSFLQFTGQAGDMKDRIAELKGALQEGGNVADLFGETIGRTGDQLSNAAAAADDLSGAMARLNGWFDKRDAVRGYLDSIDAFTNGVKDGFTREDSANIDAVARSILQVANNIKNPAAQQNFLTNARAQLETMAKTSGPRAAAAIQEVINKFDSKGLTHPPATQLTVDDKKATSSIKHVKGDLDILGRSTVKPTVSGNDNPWQSIYGKTRRDLSGLDGFTATPKISANASAAEAAIGHVRALLTGLNGTTAQTYVHVQTTGSATAKAAGGHIRGPGTETSDSIPALLSDNEYVIRAAAVRKYGVGTFDRMNALQLAQGGRVGGNPLFTSEGPRFYKRAYKHNRPFAIDGPDAWDYPYQTGLTDALERLFEKWVNSNDVPFDMAARLVDYDMRGYWLKTRGKGWHQGSHFPDTYKTPYDTTFSHESKYATKDNPFYWRGDRLIDIRDGSVVFAAGGGLISGPGGPKGDRIPAMLSNNEYVMRAAAVSKYGVGVFDKMNALRFANGGSVPSGGLPGFNDSTSGPVNQSASSSSSSTPSSTSKTKNDEAAAHREMSAAARHAAAKLRDVEKSLRGFENKLDKSQKALDRETQKLGDLTSAQSSLASATSSSLMHDPFGNGLAGLQAQTDADTNDANAMLTALRALVSKGLDPNGALFQQLAASGDVNTAQQLAALTNQGVLAEQARFQGAQSSSGAVGQFAGTETFGLAVRQQAIATNEQRDATKALNQTVRGLNQQVTHLKNEISHIKQHVSDGASEGSNKGVRDGMNDRDAKTKTKVRTGAGR